MMFMMMMMMNYPSVESNTVSSEQAMTNNETPLAVEGEKYATSMTHPNGRASGRGRENSPRS